MTNAGNARKRVEGEDDKNSHRYPGAQTGRGPASISPRIADAIAEANGHDPGTEDPIIKPLINRR